MIETLTTHEIKTIGMILRKLGGQNVAINTTNKKKVINVKIIIFKYSIIFFLEPSPKMNQWNNPLMNCNAPMRIIIKSILKVL